MYPLRPAPLSLACVLLLSGCANAPDPGGSEGGRGQGADEVYELAPVPEGGGGDLPDDVNGDGYTDLLFLGPVETAGNEGTWEQTRRLVVVYGSERGPDPTTRTGLEAGAVTAVAAAGGGQHLRAGTADLDGDGFSDIPVTTAPPSGQGVGGAAVFWGGPTGPDPDAAPVPLASVPSGEGSDGEWSPSGAAPAPGDFDGDGSADLVSFEESEGRSRLTVLYGPFERDGTPARTGHRTVDAWVGDLVPGPLAEGVPTPLLVRRGDDGEQPGNTLYLTGGGDPEAWGEAELHAGGMSVFGDFDGDGETDLAVGDDGGRNNEPGHGTESPEVDDRLNVYHGPFDAGVPEPSSVRLTRDEGTYGVFRSLGGCDLDGDGADTLAVGLGGHGVDLVDDTGSGLAPNGAPTLVRPDSGDGGAPVAHVFACADHDADGSDELVLYQVPKADWSAPLRWWVTDGSEDEAAFDGAGFED